MAERARSAADRQSLSLIATLGALVVTLAAGVLAALFKAWWTGEADPACAFMALAWSAYLVWSARASFRPRTHLPGRRAPGGRDLLLLGSGGGLLALGALTHSLTLAVPALPIGLTGYGRLLLGGTAFRPFAFPVALLGFLTPLPPRLVAHVALPLQHVAASGTAAMLQVLGVPAIRDGLLIYVGPVTVEIARSCSGLRFLSTMLVLGVVLAGGVGGKRWTARAAVVAAAVVLAVAANVARVTGTVALVHLYGVEAATGARHIWFGRTIYLVALGLLLGVAARARPSPRR